MDALERFYKSLPISGAALDAIKLLAAILMVVDHVDDIIFDREAIALNLIGRAVFPLFCFATAAAFLRGGLGSARKYAIRLLVLGILVEPISRYTRDIEALNIFFTLGLAAGVMPLLCAAGKNVQRFVFLISLVPMMLGVPDFWEYGFVGILIPATIYMSINGDREAMVWSIILLSVVNLEDIPNIIAHLSPVLAIFLITYAVAAVLGSVFWVECVKKVSWPDKARLMPKYFLHVFYPAHLIVLALIAQLL